jgi:crotonobetainyl-CoA:carnitine CoA-transferase CaiB-like acyl-CoA transferase
VVDNFDLGYEVLRQVRPDLIMLRAPAFGLDGPWRDRPGFAVTMEQAAGLCWLTGYQDGEPLSAGGPFDPIMGAHAAFAVVAAIHHRHRTGEGQMIEAPMIDMALATTSEAVLELDAYGHLLDRIGDRSSSVAPQGIYPSAGEGTWLALTVQTDDQWQALAAVLDRDDWRRSEELSGVDGRLAAQDQLDGVLAGWAAARTVEEGVAALVAAGVPATSVVPSHCIDTDPQLRARGFWQTVQHPVLGVQEYTGLPFPATSPWFTAPAPLLGQDNDELLGQLGFSAEELDGLRADQVIGNRPMGL